MGDRTRTARSREIERLLEGSAWKEPCCGVAAARCEPTPTAQTWRAPEVCVAVGPGSRAPSCQLATGDPAVLDDLLRQHAAAIPGTLTLHATPRKPRSASTSSCSVEHEARLGARGLTGAAFRAQMCRDVEAGVVKVPDLAYLMTASGARPDRSRLPDSVTVYHYLAFAVCRGGNRRPADRRDVTGMIVTAAHYPWVMRAVQRRDSDILPLDRAHLARTVTHRWRRQTGRRQPACSLHGP